MSENAKLSAINPEYPESGGFIKESSTDRLSEGGTALKLAPSPALRDYPSKLYVETTTRCNLGCFMCVKHTDGCGMTEGEMTPERFAALEPVFPHLEALVLNGIGEPLLHRRDHRAVQ